MDVRGAAGTGFFRGDGRCMGPLGGAGFYRGDRFRVGLRLQAVVAAGGQADRRAHQGDLGRYPVRRPGAATAVSHRAAGVDLFPVAAGLSAGIRHGGVRAETAADLRDRRGVAVCQRFSQSAARCGRPEGGIAGETAERTDADRTGDRLFRLHHTHYIDPDRQVAGAAAGRAGRFGSDLDVGLQGQHYGTRVRYPVDRKRYAACGRLDLDVEIRRQRPGDRSDAEYGESA